MKYKENGVFDVSWTGRTTDNYYYDGSKPDTLIEEMDVIVFTLRF